jgi:hypothetical protein
MKKTLPLLIALVSLTSLALHADEAAFSDRGGYDRGGERPFPDHHGPGPGPVHEGVGIHVYPHHDVIVLHGDDWRVRIGVGHPYRVREGVVFEEYRDNWHPGYWSNYSYTVYNGNYFWCAERNDYVIEPIVVNGILAQYRPMYPGIDYTAIRIVPYDEDGYNSVIFIALPNGQVEYVMDYTVNF